MTHLVFSKVVTLSHNETQTVRICPWDSTATNLPPEAVALSTVFSVRTDGLQPVTVRLHECGLGTGKPMNPDVLRSVDRVTPRDGYALVDSTTSGLDLNQSVVLQETVNTLMGAVGAVSGNWTLPIDPKNMREWVLAVSNTGTTFQIPVVVEIVVSIQLLYPKN